MSALSLALVLQLAADPACSVPGMTPDFWPRVVRQESHYDPFALHDDTVNQSFYPDKASVSEELATRLMTFGHSVGVGLSQLTATSPALFERKFGITIREALDPCRNMKVGARFYVSGALSIYNAGRINPAGLTYAASVMAQPSSVTSASADRPSVPPPCAPKWDAWALATCSTATKELP